MLVGPGSAILRAMLTRLSVIALALGLVPLWAPRSVPPDASRVRRLLVLLLGLVATLRLVIVGLAPGAHGANRTGRVFTGDSSGDWLYEALHRAGFASQPTSVARDDGQRLTDCYVTCAARCAPPDNKPLPDELERCRPFLLAELRLLRRTRVVLALGRVGHEAWLRATDRWDATPARERPVFAHGAEHRFADGPVLLSSFHPSRQNTQTGRLTRAMWHRVFARARALVEG